VIRIEGDSLNVETRTLAARFAQGALVELRRRADGRLLIQSGPEAPPPLQLVYPAQEAVPLAGEPGDRVVCLPLGDHAAEFRFASWNGEGLLSVAEDPVTGDLVVEPSGCASRPGLRACRWNLAGLAPDLELVAPFFQGIRLPLEDPLIHDTHWHWPHQWEAGMAILQGGEGGFWIHCRDDRYRYKSLQVGVGGQRRCLGLETEGYGPLHDCLSAGGLAWRLNVHRGDWQEPASQYRTWLAQVYRLRERPDWLREVRFAVSWCPTQPAILDALAARLEPRQVLLHLPGWRQDPYDENYPTYTASAAGRAFVEKAQGMGFRTMPHFNSIDMDPTHPVYAQVRDFQYREAESRRLQGWTWVDGQVRPVPESNAARLLHRDQKTMVKIHPGLSLWRSILAEHIRGAVENLGLRLVFLDVTLCTWNLHNCLVEDATPTEGMKRLIARIADLGLAVGGEGRNEITMQDESFAQVHLFRSWHRSAEGLERAGACGLNEFLFGQWCRSFGYSGLGGDTQDEVMRMQLHTALGAIPTVTVRAAVQLERPNQAVAEMLALAGA
jgi:hypothetical protein